MDSPPAILERPGKLLSLFRLIENTVSESYTIQCLLLLHCLSWSAESRIHFALLTIGILTIIYFLGCRHLARLFYQIAVLFSYFVVLLKGVLSVTVIFTLYEVILNIIGYHSEDYRIFKHNLDLLITEFSSVSCMWTLNTTKNTVVVVRPNDVINLCHVIWYILYLLAIALGLYIGMPQLDKIRKDSFWTNVYFTILTVVVWKLLESFLLNGWWQSAEIRRASCVYVHYIRYGEAGFTSTMVKQKT